MTRRMILLVAAFLVVGSAPAPAQPPGGGPGEGGGPGQGGGPGEQAPPRVDPDLMRAMRAKMEALNNFDIKTMWVVLSLQVTIDPARFDTMHAAFRESWSRRAAILTDTGSDTDWEAIRDEMAGMRKDLDEKIKAGLSKEELKAYQDGMKQQEQARPSIPAR